LLLRLTWRGERERERPLGGLRDLRSPALPLTPPEAPPPPPVAAAAAPPLAAVAASSSSSASSSPHRSYLEASPSSSSSSSSSSAKFEAELPPPPPGDGKGDAGSVGGGGSILLRFFFFLPNSSYSSSSCRFLYCTLSFSLKPPPIPARLSTVPSFGCPHSLQLVRFAQFTLPHIMQDQSSGLKSPPLFAAAASPSAMPLAAAAPRCRGFIEPHFGHVALRAQHLFPHSMLGQIQSAASPGARGLAVLHR